MEIKLERETREYHVTFPMERFEDDPETVLGEAEMPDEWVGLINDGWDVLTPTNLVTHANGETGKVTGSATVKFVRVPLREKLFRIEAVVNGEWVQQGPLVTLTEFFKANEGLDKVYKEQMVRMLDGERLRWNLGAGGVLTVERVL